MTSRRRFLTILAGAGTLPLLGSQARAATSEWRGIALGAEARIVLNHPRADHILALAVTEIRRLENLFSLYQSNSELSQLNRDGVLVAPSPDMLTLLSLCARIYARTNGAFDPTIQTLWATYAAQASNGRLPDDQAIRAALMRTGWDKVQVQPDNVTATQPGLQISLNGVAQGFIADKVTQLLRRQGITDAVINTGEIVALGTSPTGQPWQVTLEGKNTAPQNLTNRAIATSAALGTTFDQGGKTAHILDPRTGLPAGRAGSVTVIADNAAEADALSTAFCLMTDAEIAAVRGSWTVLFG